jgi:histidinol phosphatase-like enzyme (inositol monophosphatase family)
MDVTPYKEFLATLTHASGEVIRGYFGSPDLRVEAKADASPVTQADREAEQCMRTLIEKRFPDHGIVGEEHGAVREDADFVWMLDPIDGTISFTHGCPLFGTLVALLHEGSPILGAIHQPILSQLMVGDGTVTVLNDRPVRVREVRDLSQATLLTTDVDAIGRYRSASGFAALRARAGLFRSWGDCYGYLLVAAGFADVMLDPIMNAWDLLPLKPVIEGAGGVITTFDGTNVVGGDSAVACHPRIHADVLRLLGS